MARMYVKSKRQPNIEIVNVDKLAKIVYAEVIKTLKKSKKGSAKPNNTSPKSADAGKKERGDWKISQVGYSMLGAQLVSSMVSSNEAFASGDNAQIAMTNYTNVKGTSTLMLSTFGGPYGMVLSVILNRLDGLFGQYVKNQIQLQYDNSRLDYNLTTMDIGRNSTYTYDYEQNKWIARDVQRIKSNILNQNTSV